MDVRSKQTIKEHLQKEDAQERILQYMHKGRDEATVTISRAAELFGITENKLRDWEEYGILNPLRPGGPKGRRLYTPAELDKLAIIRELIDTGYAASDIPPDIDKLWYTTRDAGERLEQPAGPDNVGENTPINQRIEQGRSKLFWRFYVSHALRLSLALISEDMPNTTVGLILPFQPRADVTTIRHIDDATLLGESLVGWLSQSRSSHTLLTSKPSFQYSSDFRIEPLRAMKAGVPQEEKARDHTFIIVQREARPLTLSHEVVATIRRLLQPLYEDVELSRSCFGPGMDDVLDPATDLGNTPSYEDVILNGLTEIIVRLGGVDQEGQSRWLFCCLFLPHYASPFLSVQQRSLIVRAQSENSPCIIGVTKLLPQEPYISSSVKAFQSGNVIYLPDFYRDIPTMTRSQTNTMRSTIAVPVEGSDDISSAVIYVASDKKNAFSREDQCVLRMAGRMICELLETYRARLLTTTNLRAIITSPSLVDTLFQEFLSENDFIAHVADILSHIQARTEFQPSEVVSFIAIDIDRQSGIANRYGEHLARELCRAVGLRIHSQLRAFKDEAHYKLYHICADRFYILLNGMHLEQARTKAELLKKVIEGNYQIDQFRSPVDQATLPENRLMLSNITVHIGISSYQYVKLKEILHRCAAETAVIEASMQVTGFLEEELALGQKEGGNVLISWDPRLRGFVRLPV